MKPKPTLFARILAAAGSIAAVAPAAAVAQFQTMEPFYCEQMQADYLALAKQAASSGGGVPQDKIERIRRDLMQAQMAAQRNNCTRFLFARPTPACPRIMGEIQRLQNQLSRAGGGLFGFGGLFAARDPAFERDRMRDMLRMNGCSIPELAGTRTICVRTCDGYYFPISFSASQGRFKTDAAVCQSMYAEDGQAELYIGPNAADVSRAKSLDGKIYGEQPFAFAYRSSYNKACATELHAGLAALGARYTEVRLERRGAGPAKTAKAVPLPSARPDRYEDPETLANLSGGLLIRPAEDVGVAALSSKAVRIIGPAYYADLFDLTKPPQPSRFDFGIIGSAKADELRPTVKPAEVPADEAEEPSAEP